MMGFYNNMKIRTRLIAGFVLVTFLSLVVGLVGLNSLAQLTYIGEVFSQVHSRALTLLAVIADQLGKSRASLRDIALVRDETVTFQNLVTIDFALKQIEVSADELAALVHNTGMPVVDMIDDFITSFNNYYAVVKEVMTSFEAGDYDSGYNILFSESNAEAVNGVLTALDVISTEGLNIVDGSSEEQREISRNAEIMMIGGVIVSLVVGVGLGIFVSQTTSKAVREIGRAVDSMASGDFTTHIEIYNKSDLGVLAGAFNAMIDNLRDVLNKVNGTALVVDDASKQVSSSSMSLAQISTEQASSVEQISASMSEITSQTKANAENASKATELSSKTRDNAIRGNDMMGEMLNAMQAINDTSNSISSIIKVIDDIAFQTNILALNAAVEAARAGQHGRGFAVVAEEVRNLAARSQKAASETTQMIEGAIKEVARGTQIANDTAEALNEIVEGVSESATLVSEISDASENQSQGASQISAGMEQVSQAIQTTSSVAEEAASSSSELSDQANTLKELISMFKFEGGKSGRSHSDRLTGDGGNQKSRPRIPELSGAAAPARAQANNNVPDIRLGTGDFGKY